MIQQAPRRKLKGMTVDFSSWLMPSACTTDLAVSLFVHAAQSLTTRPSKKDQKEARKAAAYLQCRNLQRRNRHLLGRAPPAESVIINQ
mmetsp:Transcript_28153/g.47758  ORF Transcript_28153/g.47758 Transcript_28153/m.47758 type:complete len:88 (-) Transcript_28153:2628-2891(-)